MARRNAAKKSERSLKNSLRVRRRGEEAVKTLAASRVFTYYAKAMTTQSALGKKIRLTKAQWAHIRIEHAELDSQHQSLRETLQAPDFICYNATEDSFEYYRHYAVTPVTAKYLKVVARHLNEEGFVITAFYLTKIKKRGRRCVYGQEIFARL